MDDITFRALFPFGGSGGGALGFAAAEARLFGRCGRFEVDLAGPTVDARALGGAGWDAPEHARTLPSPCLGGACRTTTGLVNASLCAMCRKRMRGTGPDELSPVHHQGSEGSRMLAPETGLEPEPPTALSSNLGELTETDGPSGDRQKPPDPNAPTQSIAAGDRIPGICPTCGTWAREGDEWTLEHHPRCPVGAGRDPLDWALEGARRKHIARGQRAAAEEDSDDG